ncbi:MAG TPA: phenylalanine--tRNA ligase subunit alpha, partial [Actinomycetota bacterium]|nr:phenylalanine--tRNA ligase subunit alpha [Actinomycetota bacterium]
MTPDTLISELHAVRDEALAALDTAADSQQLRQLEIQFLGRKGPLARVGKSLASLPVESRKTVGRAANEVRDLIESQIAEKRSRLEILEQAGRWEAERVDVTLPGRRPPAGRLHPLTQVLEEIVDVFVGLGYQVAEGPVIETDYYNFQALNFPPDHPARSMHDTFYVESDGDTPLLLRTHTSPMQIRSMEASKPPLYVVFPGTVCRRDEVDANHLAVFTQIEGLAVDEGISFADLKGTLEVFAKATFGSHLEVRMNPSYFPFTEPSAEVYVSCFACDKAGCPTCKGEGWIEIMGAGMVHPNVFRAVGYDPEITGFAFGMGVERIAKLRYAISDLRS